VHSGARIPVLALAILMLMVAPALAQVSPGPLATAHQEVDSPLKCFNCHGQGQEAMRDRCLACHQEVAWLAKAELGLHGQKGMEKCASCHPDHAGRDFAMIAWEEGSPERFDHARTGWRLGGRHLELKCGDCHKPVLQTSESLRLSKRRKPEGSWLGLERACVSCHTAKDVHRGSLGKDCAKCHDDRVWKPAPLFDHGHTDYPLTGKHIDVTCDKCHLAASLKPRSDDQGRPIPVYKPVPHQECSTCHADPHTGRLGPDCARCHATGSWKKVDAQVFNHDRTRYPLRARHAAVKCETCHDPRLAWGKKPPFAACTDCHADKRTGRDDPHAGLATLQGKKADCAACHDEGGWKASTYTVARHATADYTLAGKHAAVKCDACHRKEPPGPASAALGKAGVLIRMRHARCRDCHEDAHAGQLAKRADGGACEPCHGVAGWKPSLYTVKEHAMLRLPLAGRHATVACAACHGPQRRGLPPLPGKETLGTAAVMLKSKEIECTACHVDPHAGRFAGRSERAKPAGCLACHDTRTFRPANVSVAAHRGFGYALEGAHRAVACDACHKESKGRPLDSSLLLPARRLPAMPFAVKDQRCEACHQNPHGDQFARRKDHGACVACHNEDMFRPATRFDHTRDAGFALDGGHARVACVGCHPARRDAKGHSVVVYRPVPKECKACHAEKRS